LYLSIGRHQDGLNGEIIPDQSPFTICGGESEKLDLVLSMHDPALSRLIVEPEEQPQEPEEQAQELEEPQT